MINYITTLYLVLLLSLPCQLYSQRLGTIRFENSTNNSIISDSNIRAITEDKKGFLWVASSNGLCRYDPNGIVTPILKDSSNTLQSNSIRSLLSDRSDNLWIGTFAGGLTRFNPHQNTWKTFFPDAKDPTSISNEDILSILEDRHGRIWVGTENGLNILDPQTETFTRFYPKKEDETALQAKAIIHIMEDDAGRIWLGTWSGGLYLALPHASGALNKITFRRFNPGVKKPAHNVWHIFQDQQQRYWVSTYGAGVFLMQLPAEVTNDPSDQNWEPRFHQYKPGDHTAPGLQSNLILEIGQDQENRLWITSNYGISHIEPEDLPDTLNNNFSSKNRPVLKFNTHLNHLEKSHSIKNNCINTLYTDKNNITWFGTLQGLSRFNPNPILFDYFSFAEIMTERKNNQNIYIDQEQKAWIANNEKGLLLYDLKNKAFIDLPSNLKAKITTANGLYAKDNYLYLGTQDGFQKLNLKNFQIETFTLPDDLIQKISAFNVSCLLVDDFNQLWLGTRNGLIQYDFSQQQFFVHQFSLEDTTSISNNSISSILQDSRGSIWVTTYNGLNKVQNIHKKHITFRRFKNKQCKNSNSIISNQVIGIEEANKELYLYTTAGLCKFDPVTESFSAVFSKGKKLLLSSLKHLEKNYLWGSCTQGIARYNLQDQTYTLYGKENGIWDLNFNPQSIYQAADGNIYFGSRNGLIRCHPDNIKTNTSAPEVYITEANLFSDYQDTSINTIPLKTLFIPKDYKNLSLTFTTLNFDRSQNNQYSFRLKGFEETWHTPQHATTVHYTNLNHGSYTFQVKGANHDGTWSELSTDLPIVVEAQFYETNPFYALVFCAISGIIFLIFKIYGQALTYRNQKMERLVEKRTKELAAKNEEVESLLQKLQSQNEVLEATVNQRTKRLIEANEELVRSNQDLEQFAYIASHDLQEPLRTVGSFVNLLGRRYGNQLDEGAKQYIEFAVDGVTRMSNLITNLLIYSKVGKKEIEFSPVNIANVIELKVRDLQTKIEERNVQIDIDLNGLPLITCEKEQIGMIFYNLINNGIKFNTNADPKISVKYHLDGSADHWMFSVADNGIGIKPEYQDKIFEIFRRLHAKNEYEGSGIGLALCKKIVFRHKGKIWVESNPGQGSTFYFTISKHLAKIEANKATILAPQKATIHL